MFGIHSKQTDLYGHRTFSLRKNHDTYIWIRSIKHALPLVRRKNMDCKLKLKVIILIVSNVDVFETWFHCIVIVDVDEWRVSSLIIGLVLFFWAKSLGENTLLYYATGITIGICASFMVLVYIVSRMLPGVIDLFLNCSVSQFFSLLLIFLCYFRNLSYTVLWWEVGQLEFIFSN